jgi:hypothetical protein
VLAAGLAITALLSGAGVPADAVVVRNPRVEVTGEVSLALARTAADLAQAAWPTWVETFGKEPRGTDLPMLLVLHPDRASFQAAARDAGAVEDLSGVGGWTSWRGAGSFVFLQPSEFDTRRLVLHELTHQFQALAFRDGNPRADPFWHREGLAERIGWHRRTARGLEVGRRDAIARVHRPAEAARRVREEGFDPWALLTGRATPSYTDALLLVETFVSTSDADLRERYLRWQEGAFSGRLGTRRFEEAFRDRREAVLAAVAEVWHGFEPPWEAPDHGWDEEPAGIRRTGAEESVLAGFPGGPFVLEAVVSASSLEDVGLAVRGTTPAGEPGAWTIHRGSGTGAVRLSLEVDASGAVTGRTGEGAPVPLGSVGTAGLRPGLWARSQGALFHKVVVRRGERAEGGGGR